MKPIIKRILIIGTFIIMACWIGILHLQNQARKQIIDILIRDMPALTQEAYKQGQQQQ